MKNKIKCIIEENDEYHNSYYDNIPIVSPGIFFESYSNYPVIITPKGFEKEIEQILIKKGVTDIICYQKYLLLSDSFTIPLKYYLKRFDKKKKIVLYVNDVLGYFFYNYLIEHCFLCYMAFSSARVYNSVICQNILKWKKDNICDAQVILTTSLTQKDQEEITGSDIKCAKFFEHISTRDFYYNPTLELFKNIHKGKRCFIVATGPSLEIKDLNKLYQNKEICIGVNGIFASFDKTNWRPGYYVAGDRNAVSKWKKEIIQENIEVKFIADTGWIFNDEEIGDNIYWWHVFKIVNEGKLPRFSDDFSRGTFAGWTIVYDGALQLAAYMGFSEIYLLGVDCNYVKGGCNNYFFKEDKKDFIDHRESEMILSYRAARMYADSHGIKIYNATRGGMLEEFERVDFDSLFLD